MSSQPGILVKLNMLPRNKGTHHMADYVELLTLTLLDGEFSPADLIERWDERQDLGERPPDLDDRLDDEEDGPIDQPSPDPGASKAAQNDRRTRIAADVFEHLAYRAGAFGDAYPFTVTTGTFRLLKRRAKLSEREKLYVFLLLASSISYIRSTSTSVLTRGFERLAVEVLRHWLPSGAEVHIFGTSASDESGDARYQGSLWRKVQKLADDIGEVVLLKETDFSPHDVGDLGLDAIAWLPVGDKEPGLPVWFAQATCQVDWKPKQHESGANWRRYLRESAPRGNLLFIPYCFRQPDGHWYDAKWPTASVVLDRARLLWLLKEVEGPLEPLPYDAVVAATEQREPAL